MLVLGLAGYTGTGTAEGARFEVAAVFFIAGGIFIAAAALQLAKDSDRRD